MKRRRPEHEAVDESKEDQEEEEERKVVNVRKGEGPLSLTNLLWFFGAAVVFYYSNVVNVLRYSHDINSSWAYAGLGLFFTNILIGLYLVIWLTHVKKIDPEEWTSHYPSLVPMATAAFILGSLMLTVGLWPAYGLLTVPLLFTIFMGMLMIVINLPSWV